MTPGRTLAVVGALDAAFDRGEVEKPFYAKG